jgi:hypothetical protein
VSDDHGQIASDFDRAVNMTPSELGKWLESDESKAVGQKNSEGAESVGHHSGRRIIDIRQKKKSELTDNDYDHMKKVVGYVSRHSAQRPKSDVESSNWRYSLMNWGHDPLK